MNRNIAEMSFFLIRSHYLLFSSIFFVFLRLCYFSCRAHRVYQIGKGGGAVLTVLRVLTVPPLKRRRRQRLPAWGERRIVMPLGEYRLLTAVSGGDGIDWAAIREAAGGEAARLLLPAELAPPTGCGVIGFRGNALARALMERTLCDRLREWNAPRHMAVGIYDPAARMPLLPLSLLPLAAEVRVVTRQPARYAETARRAMTEQGAGFWLGEDWRALRELPLIAAPDGLDGLPLIGTLGTYAAVEQRRHGVIDGYLPAQAPRLRPFVPPDILPERFYAALYECGGVTALAAEPPAALHQNGYYDDIHKQPRL